jgi:hypothetical protein
MEPASQKASTIDGKVPRRPDQQFHAVVNDNGLSVRLALSPCEAHDVRLAGKLLSRLEFE